MKLQDRNLSLRMKGDDVALLQQELKKLGFDIGDEQGTFGEATKKAVLVFQRKNELEITGEVEERTAAAINRAVEAIDPAQNSVVHGRLIMPDGAPIMGATIKAFDRDIRGDVQLGEAAKTDQNGAFVINYRKAQLSRAEKARADLFVRAYDEAGKEIAISKIIFDAPDDLELDPLIRGNEAYRGPSEFSKLNSALEPWLKDVDINKITDEQISYLSTKTGLDSLQIGHFINSKLLKEECNGAIPDEIFYGLLRHNLPPNLSALLSQDPMVQRHSLESAMGENIISKQPSVDDSLKTLRSQIVENALKEVEGKTSLKSLLTTVLPDLELQKGFLNLYVQCHEEHKEIKTFWEELAGNPAFKDHAGDLQWTLQMAAFTGYHLPLVKELQAQRKEGKIKDIKDLAKKEVKDWMDLINKQVDGKPIGYPPEVPGREEDKPANYAKAMVMLIEDSFPTAFTASRIANDDIDGKEGIAKFFENNPIFDITATRFETYLSKHPQALDGIDNKDLIRKQIRSMQRLYKIARRYAQRSILMKNNILSSQKIVQMGYKQFLLKDGDALGGQSEAKIIFERAQQVAGMATNLLFSYGLPSSRISLNAVSDTVPKEVDGIPDLQTLFGSIDMCECEHCRSVHSPPAYLVDMLNFLRQRTLAEIKRDANNKIISVKYQQKSAKGVLFQRRPDIGKIELTCENTNTTLPYVDLLNEILENAVSPYDQFTPFFLDLILKDDLDKGILSPTLKAALSLLNPPLAPDAHVVVIKKGERWLIEDLAFTYTIRKLWFNLGVQRGHQTSGKAEERAANPQYINLKAYEKLKEQVFPWSLPFDLWSEEVRSYLDHQGIKLWQLMESLSPGDRLKILENDAVAIEYLGLTMEEAKIINGTTKKQSGLPNPGIWNLWGFAEEKLSQQACIPDPANSTKWIDSVHWLNDVLAKRVDVVLQQSGLKYIELLDLLGTYYINPLANGLRKIEIAGGPETCELVKLELKGFSQDDAIKLMRFVRLWRKLGWKIHDLDRAITAFNPPDLNDNFLRQLSHVKRLQTLLGLPLSSLLCFWAQMDTAKYIDHAAVGQPTIPSMYEQLFRNKAIINPLDLSFPEDPDDIDSNLPLSEHAATITCALGISVNDLNLLMKESKITPDDKLKLDNLSRLFRHSALAKALKLSISDYISIFKLMDIDPFADTATTILFAERVDKIRSSGFSILELNYLLRHEFALNSGLAPAQDSIAIVLDELRKGLKSIVDENIFIEHPSDPINSTKDSNGDTTREKLALINWDSSVIEKVISTLNDSVVYETSSKNPLPADINSFLPNDTGTYQVPLSQLPTKIPQELEGVVIYDSKEKMLKTNRALTAAERDKLLKASFDQDYQKAVKALFEQPQELQGKISYDVSTNKLRFVGAMTITRRDKLAQLSNDQSFMDALKELFFAPRNSTARYMRLFSIRDFEKTLPALPAKVEFPKSLKEKIYFDTVNRKLHFLGPMTENERDLLLSLSKIDDQDPNHIPYQAAIKELFKMQETTPLITGDEFLIATGAKDDISALFDNSNTPADRFGLVLKKLLPHVRIELSKRLIIQKLSEALKLEAESAGLLLTESISSPAHPKEKLIEEFLDPTFIDSDLKIKASYKAFKSQFDAFILLQKIAQIISRFKISSIQLEWLFNYSKDAGWLDLGSLPVSVDPASSVKFKGWERLVDLFRLRDELSMGEEVLSSIFELSRKAGISQDDLLTEINLRTQWDLDNLSYLSSGSGLGLTFPDACKDERGLLRLKGCLTMQKRLGISAKLLCDLKGGDVSSEISRSIIQAVKAKYSDDQWLQIAKQLRDVLREKQRLALVAHHVTHPIVFLLPDGKTTKPAWRDVNGLYSYFLIDVEMSACQMTSRIVQATSSVQLFVQRCLMNLEHEVKANLEIDDGWLQWDWMKNYRVWEANRKIFLYPENWIEPELRDDKSPFFKELESELLQNELTQDTAETAFLHYLEKLDAVTRLEIVGMFHEVETDDGTAIGNKLVDRLHVFGRTQAIPHVYYYRRHEDSGYWTAWEKVEAGIEGDHLIPVVWNRRLYLFWPIFTEKQEEVTLKVEIGKELPPGERYLDIQMAWSEYKNGNWTPKRVSVKSTSLLDLPAEFGVNHQKNSKIALSFRADPSDNEVIVYCYLSPTDFGVYDWEVQNSRKKAIPIREFHFMGHESDLEINKGTFWEGGEKNTYYWPRRSTPANHFEFMMLRPDIDPNRTYFWFQDLWLWEYTDKFAHWILTSPSPYSILYPHRYEAIECQDSFFYQDKSRTFIVIPKFPDKKLTFDQMSTTILGNQLNYYFESMNVIASSIPQMKDSNLLPVDPRDPMIFEQSLPAYSSRSISGRSNPISIAIPNETVPKSSNITTYSSISDYNIINLYFLFNIFYHPYVRRFVKELNRDGIDGLMQRSVQQLSNSFFEDLYAPSDFVIKKDTYPKEEVDFSYGGAYSLYNWELFFHAPFLIAQRLGRNQRFSEAQKWFHYIFNPTDTSGYEVPQRYWITKPFFETSTEKYQAEKISEILHTLAKGGSSQEIDELRKEVKEWRKNPFKPHLIARMRNTAYQKAVAMKYIDNLILWGDQSFRQDTMESINEATQLYILAAEILGLRPEKIPPRAVPEVQTYDSIEPLIDEFSDALVQVEEFIPPSADIGTLPTTMQPQVTIPLMQYFCVSKNDNLLAYWDKVADRLFKIRHCMNIEGMIRQLPLFAPLIEPGLLVKAAAAGIDISSVLSEINAPLPCYRFTIWVQKTIELLATVNSLGNALLTALEKRDAEALALLRSKHEIDLLSYVRLVKEKQVEEAQDTLDSLKNSRIVVEARKTYYENLLKEPISKFEQEHLDFLDSAWQLQASQAAFEYLAFILHLIPGFKAGSPTTIGVYFSGAYLASSSSALAAGLGSTAATLGTKGTMSATKGGYERRKDEWDHQLNLATKEFDQIDKQIAAAEVRKAIADQELKNHDLQVENAKEIDASMRSKFTNQELYDWMIGKISSVYFQSYQLAYDVAKKAERAYQYELGLDDSNLVKFGYWDSLKKGLLAAEGLSNDVRRMELSYLDKNKREYEITKSISLEELDPWALVALKQTGECYFSLPEAIFDLDFPGHYFRRIKSVSLTIPCVTGPYVGVNCTLTLLKSSIRKSNIVGEKYARQEEDLRFTDRIGAIQSIVTSSGQNDNGMFETNLRDERYLPFEGSGAISEWHIKIPKDFKQFDPDTISTVVITLRYTAREGGAALGNKATEEMRSALNEFLKSSGKEGLARVFSLRHEFSSEWYRFLNPPADEAKDQNLIIPLNKERFPFLFRDRKITIIEIGLLVKVHPDYVSDYDKSTLKLSLEPGLDAPVNVLTLESWNGLLKAVKSPAGDLGNWILTAWFAEDEKHQRLDPKAIEEVLVLCRYALD